MGIIDLELPLRLSPPITEPDRIGSAPASRPCPRSEIGSSRRGLCQRFTPQHDEQGDDRGKKRQRCNQEPQCHFGSSDAVSVAVEDSRPTLPICKQRFPLCVQRLNNPINTFEATQEKPSSAYTHLQMQPRKLTGFDDLLRTPAYSNCRSNGNQRDKPQMDLNKPQVITDCQNRSFDVIGHAPKDCGNESNSNGERMEGSRQGNEETNACQTISHNIQDQNSNNDIRYSSNNVANNSRKASHETRTRKVPRWWSLELHTNFMEAVSRLGGPKLASPNHILELMNVDGLSSHEVKSHLQKYRKQEGQHQPIVQALNARAPMSCGLDKSNKWHQLRTILEEP